VWCEQAVLNGKVHGDVLIDMVDGRFTSIAPGSAQGAVTRLAGLTIPGLANAHSHAFHRALRSRTQADRGTFWTWRDLMYGAAERLEPDTYYRLARAVFGEMVLAGISCVGEFHYIHHQGDGTTYSDPNEMGLAMLAAADAAGIRITLLDTVYLHGGLDRDGYSQPEGTQRRFSDQTVDHWIERVDGLNAGETHRIGTAIHSVRAVAPSDMSVVAKWAARGAGPVHCHISEQPAENEACQGFHGASPIGVVHDAGLLSPHFTAVHATHLDAGDVAALARSGSTVAMCPTTERDLGDGIGPSRPFVESQIPIALGSDSHAVIDMFDEVRAVELHERLRSQERGVHSAVELLDMATVNGHRSLGWSDAGAIAVGNRADLVTVDLDSVRTAGTAAAGGIESAIFAATASDVSNVFIDGRCVVADYAHIDVDVAAELSITIQELMGRD
jgi:formiminoglutamate deiminase